MINSLNKNRGFITLTVTLIIIILVTILSLTTGRMLMNEQRSVSNQLRYKEAMNSAQAGLEQAMAEIKLTDSWPGSISSAVGTEKYNTLYREIGTIKVGSGSLPVLELESTGISGYNASALNGSSESIVTLHQNIYIGKVLNSSPASPLTVAASMVSTGNFSIASNPNGGGSGVPLSIWASGNVDVKGSSSTCALGDYDYTAKECIYGVYSDQNTPNYGDILDNDNNFPENLKSYLFGYETVSGLVTYLKSIGATSLTSCDDLGPSSEGYFIITGDCKPSKIVGSEDKPVVLVIIDGDLIINGQTSIYGLVFTTNSDGNTSQYKVSLTGGATVYGALVDDHTYDANNTSGTYNIIYDATVLKNIEESPANTYVSKISGSWHDW
nr:PilX N-terminal domain-containing pilus assembly protein [uncultured Tolumonas sp.]